MVSPLKSFSVPKISIHIRNFIERKISWHTLNIAFAERSFEHRAQRGS